MPYHLIASELINQLLYINFPSLKRKILLKDLKSTLLSSVALPFGNLGISEVTKSHPKGDDDKEFSMD